MKFRKKPVVIEAVQFTEAMMHACVLDQAPPPEGVDYVGSSYHSERREVYHCKFAIQTLEGRMEVMPNDWVITGVKGERYPCKPDIFAATYESAEDSTPAQRVAEPAP